MKKIKSFYNCIDMGDIVYSLLFCKILNVDTMYIDANCNVKFNWESAKFILPLLKSQTYMNKVELFSGQEYDCNYGLHPENVPVVVDTNLTHFHASKFGIQYKDNVLHNTNWITSGKYDNLSHKKILINRTSRYHGDKSFYFKMLFSFPLDNFIFAGLENEYKNFKKEFGVDIDYIPTNDILSLASLVNSVPIFLGNESLICALATGLGKSCYIEYGRNAANYLFNRQNIFYF